MSFRNGRPLPLDRKDYPKGMWVQIGHQGIGYEDMCLRSKHDGYVPEHVQHTRDSVSKRVQTGHHLCWTRFVLLPEKLTPSELTDSISGNGASRTKGQKTFVTGPTTVLQNIFSLLVAPSRKRA